MRFVEWDLGCSALFVQLIGRLFGLSNGYKGRSIYSPARHTGEICTGEFFIFILRGFNWLAAANMPIVFCSNFVPVADLQ